MPTLKEVKIRIEGVQNTQKITRAMKIVAATKLKKREREMKKSRLYSEKLQYLLENLIRYAYHPDHILLKEKRNVNRTGVLVIASDRGLCGAFNSNLFRKTHEVLTERKKIVNPALITVGKRTRDFFKRTDFEIIHSEVHIEKETGRQVADRLSDMMVKMYMEDTIGNWIIISNQFTNKINFEYSQDTLIPVTIPRQTHRDDSLYRFEDSQTDVLEYMVPRFVSDQIYKRLIESQTAEEMARMMAMDYATENAEELIGELTLFYNRTRQQVITKEISEIVGGAEALK